MARSKAHRQPNMTLRVLLWGREVGRLVWDDRKGVSVFAYSKDYIADGPDVSPLDMSVRSPMAYLPVSGRPEEFSKYNGLPPFIADSLPDKWGNEVFSEWARKNGLDPDRVSPVHKLAFIGRRGMGALEFEPEETVRISQDSIEIREIIELAEKIGTNREETRILADEEITLQSLYLVGTSAGGQRKKAIIAMNDSRTDIRSGQVMGLERDGLRYYILKFNEREDFPSAEIEAAFYDMACSCGIRMEFSDLFPVEGVNHFLTERFDRKDRMKIHMQTLAAMRPGTDSYEALFSVCRELGLPEKELQELFCRAVFDVFSGNTDDHDKNVSFLMGPDGTWHLAPAYDVTFTADIFNPGMIYRRRSICGKNRGITAEDLLALAESKGIKGANAILSKVFEALTGWRETATRRGVFPQWIDLIEKYISELLPEEYSARMRGWILPPFKEYRHPSGQVIAGMRFEEHERGAVHMLATIDGRVRKHVFAPGKDETLEIKRLGLDRMPYEKKTELLDRYF